MLSTYLCWLSLLWSWKGFHWIDSRAYGHLAKLILFGPITAPIVCHPDAFPCLLTTSHWHSLSQLSLGGGGFSAFLAVGDGGEILWVSQKCFHSVNVETGKTTITRSPISPWRTTPPSQGCYRENTETITISGPVVISPDQSRSSLIAHLVGNTWVLKGRVDSVDGALDAITTGHRDHQVNLETSTQLCPTTTTIIRLPWRHCPEVNHLKAILTPRSILFHSLSSANYDLH